MIDKTEMLDFVEDIKNTISEKQEQTIFDYKVYSLCSQVQELLKEQEAKTGYWIDSAGNDKCSICGAEYSDLYPDYGNTHFCPNCVAKMKGR